MTVVADTSPLNYLVQIDEIDLLPDLFERVLLPNAVLRELTHPEASPKVKQWSLHLPAWAEVHTSRAVTSSALLSLDIGEREAIQLALDLGIETILLDEADGRRKAKTLKLEVHGTLGIVERGCRLGNVDFRTALSKLEQKNFRISAEVRKVFLRRTS